MKKSFQQQVTIKWLVFALFILSWGSIKISLPALPRLAEVFSTSANNLKLSVTLFFICYATSQVIWGSLSEYYGRRKIILAGLFITFCGSITAMLANQVGTYLVGRCLEGIGMGSISPSCRAILADIYEKKVIASTMGVISLTVATMPVLAPLIGGYLVVYISWRAIFTLFACLSVIYFIVVMKKLPETIHSRKHNLSLTTLIADYKYLIKQPLFWGYSLCYASLSGFILGYYAAMPFWFVTQFGVKENNYAYLALFNVAAYIAGILLTRRLNSHFTNTTLILAGSSLTIAASLASLVIAHYYPATLTCVIIIMMLFTFCGGFTFPNATAGALSAFKDIAGPASALMTMVMFLTAGISSLIAANLTLATLWPLAYYLCFAAAICFIAGYILVWRNQIAK